ncbi:hypothetical protein GWI33_010008 [Rhynchophorus ferrugineus]|uniref:Uncharacterized protein n=1 Tax=Rhynchophorus ferrugineus TaxID=354439 RepID=A0A834IBD6_RHYFE|nr:hypothetical protein GWI33_010008 [Rhynchophorus ferrugineus]
MLAQDAIGQTSLDNVTSVVQAVFLYSLFFEFVGFCILAIHWIPQFGLAEGGYYAFFYSVSAFNNAGFSLFPDGMIRFQKDAVVCLTISSLYIIGGLGFLVLMDIQKQRRWQKLSTNSKLVLSTIIGLNVIAFVLIWTLETGNPNTLQPLSWGEQAVNAWFQATVPRSSGFNSVDINAMTHGSIFLTMLLMFIGGGSLSTAGGIKVGTFIVLLLSVRSFLRRDDEVRVFERTIPQNIVLKALAVGFITSMLVFIGIFFLAVLEPRKDTLDLMFEVVSAACTVGLSRGVTGDLNHVSLMILTLLMFVGRLGPLSLAYLIATPKKSRIKYVDSNIQIG